MSKDSTKGTRYAINWQTHPKNLMKNFCSLMEHQSLVDVVICCGNNTIQAHKFVLAANSPLFREEFERNPLIEQIMIGGCEFVVLKNVVEIMYCGQTIVNEDNIKFVLAVIKLFQMKHLENMFTNHTMTIDDIYLPKPQFLTKKPKYPAFTYQLPQVTSQNACVVNNISTNNPQQQTGTQITSSISNAPLTTNPNILKPIDCNINVSEPVAGFKSYGRGKRTLKQQAEQACAKEAQASRLALASLQKEIAAAPQVNTFVIEDTCTETTVENFIPHSESKPFVLNCNDIISDSLENAMFLPVSISDSTNQGLQGPYSNITCQINETDKCPRMANKLKAVFDSQTPTNVEIMYKDADGNFVPINEEVLRNLSAKEGLQYQVIDEEGRVSEIQELHVIDKIDQIIDNVVHEPVTDVELLETTMPRIEVGDFLKETDSCFSIKDGGCSVITKTGEKITISSSMDTNQTLIEHPSLEPTKSESDIDLKFSPDVFFSEIIPNEIQNEVTIIEDDVFIETMDKK